MKPGMSCKTVALQSNAQITGPEMPAGTVPITSSESGPLHMIGLWTQFLDNCTTKVKVPFGQESSAGLDDA